jgi:hypothetical protein
MHGYFHIIWFMDINGVIFQSDKENKKDKAPDFEVSRKTNADIDATADKSKSSERKRNLSEELIYFLEDFYKKKNDAEKKSKKDLVKVSDVFGTIAFFYEKVRNAVEYKGEHLLRRNAIARILRRKIWERPDGDPEKFSDDLIRELIWARYFKNDFVPKNSLKEIQEVLLKYLALISVELSQDEKLSRKKASEIKEWYIGVASAEIENILDPAIDYWEPLNNAVSAWIRKNFEWQDKNIDELEKDDQILIAVQRSLSKYDKERVRFQLLNKYIPEWKSYKEQDIALNYKKAVFVRNDIEKKLNSPIQPKIYRYVQKQSAAFQVLKEIVEENFENIDSLFEDRKALEKEIERVCNRRYSQIGKRVNTGIVRSIVYIFVTKIILALAFEIPVDLLLYKELLIAPLLINALFPPFLMVLVGLSIKKPDEENTKRIIERIRDFSYPSKKEEKVKFTLSSAKRTSIAYRAFSVMYLILSFLVFTFLAYVLMLLGFNLISGGIFFMFISLVLLFGYRVRYTASELNVKGERDSFTSHFLTNLTLPLLNLGIWLSEGLSRFNFIIIFMDFLIEVPLKRIIKVFEEWTSFIKERREEVVEVPTN